MDIGKKRLSAAAIVLTAAVSSTFLGIDFQNGLARVVIALCFVTLAEAGRRELNSLDAEAEGGNLLFWLPLTVLPALGLVFAWFVSFEPIAKPVVTSLAIGGVLGAARYVLKNHPSAPTQTQGRWG